MYLTEESDVTPPCAVTLYLIAITFASENLGKSKALPDYAAVAKAVVAEADPLVCADTVAAVSSKII